MPDAAKPADSLGSERYLKICRRLTVLPEPLFLRTLRAPYDYDGIYSTAVGYAVDEKEGASLLANV